MEILRNVQDASMLDVSSSKPVANKRKEFAFRIEFGEPGAGYLSCAVCELLYKSRGFDLCAPKG